jgi:hypothetical protein
MENTKLSEQGGVYAHGFAILELDAESANAAYFQDLSNTPRQMFSETIA